MRKIIGASVFVAAVVFGGPAFALAGGYYDVCRENICQSHPNTKESVPMHQGEIFSDSGNTYHLFHSGPANPTPEGFVGKTESVERWGLPTR